MPAAALATDFYQLTMIAGYLATGRHGLRATFELFTRRLPPNRHVLVFAGLDQALDYLEALRFDEEDVAWLASLAGLSHLPPAFFEYLRTFRFTGDVDAMPEGTAFFPNEPVLRITAPLAEAQLVETALLAIVNFQTTIASKAVRIVEAALGRPVLEFGARRAHGLDAALNAARAAHIAGCASTSFVEAGRRFGIPLVGTMAHSWVLAAESETAAFRDYASLFGPRSVMLLDTYDVVAAARAVAASGLTPSAVRLDSGDLSRLSREVRGILDAAGLAATRIVVSGDLDEWKVRDLAAGGAPVDAYAVGTALATSDDAPALGGVYKLVEVEGPSGLRPVMKRSPGKETRPGAKQVWRVFEAGRAARDIVALVADPAPPDGAALLVPQMRAGRRLGPAPDVHLLRARCLEQTARLPRPLLALEPAPAYPVEIAPGLAALMGQQAPQAG